MQAEAPHAEAHATVAVPYLFNEPTLAAIKGLEAVGLGWKLSGNPRQYSYVKSQNPFPEHLVTKGSIVDLYVVVGPTP